MKRLRSGGPAPVAGFAARACARALRVDLGHHDRRGPSDRLQLKGNATVGLLL
jgi:hypothetical protein